MSSAMLLFSSRTGWGHKCDEICAQQRGVGVLAQVPVSLLRFHCLALAVWFQYKLTLIPLQNIKMVKEAVVSGMVKPQRMQLTNKQMENTHKGIWLKVQACFEAVWRDMGTGEYRATAKDTLGIPPSDALEKVKALRIKLVAERQMRKPHKKKEKKKEKRKSELLTRHKLMSQKVFWPSWNGGIKSFLSLRLLLQNGWCLNLYRAANSHFLSLLLSS